MPVTISATAFYKVVDAHRACFDVQDYETSVLAVSTSALRSTIGKFSCTPPSFVCNNLLTTTSDQMTKSSLTETD